MIEYKHIGDGNKRSKGENKPPTFLTVKPFFEALESVMCDVIKIKKDYNEWERKTAAKY